MSSNSHSDEVELPLLAFTAEKAATTMRTLILCSVTGLLVLFTSATASAGVCDLTTEGSSCGPSLMTNQAIFGQVDPQPTGTGVVDPFLRLQANGHEEGYNTSASPFQATYDQKAGIWTHDILLGDVPVVNVNGVDYREFWLDINENNSASGHLLSLDQLRIYLSPTGNLNNYNASNKKLNGLNAIYDLDSGQDNWIKLDYSLNHGSGSGDMVAYIPDVLFTGPDSQYLYLFSRFGDQIAANADSDAGFEEWWVKIGDSNEVTEVPEPATLLLFGTGLALAARKRRKTSR
jgi:hypothetical protein